MNGNESPSHVQRRSKISQLFQIFEMFDFARAFVPIAKKKMSSHRFVISIILVSGESHCVSQFILCSLLIVEWLIPSELYDPMCQLLIRCNLSRASKSMQILNRSWETFDHS